uniref:Opsin 9 n=1 Tax=Takifugu rubripes TaxID=31033 RepID=H2SBV8_TAKRU
AGFGKCGVSMTGKNVPPSIHPLFLSRLSPSVDVAAAIFLMFTGATSALGNGMVLLVYCRKRNKLRPPELMTINLAVCDLGFSLLGVPFFITSCLCHAWVFGETMCRWYGIQGFVFGIASLLTTCLISVERCLKICSLKYGQWVEKRHISLSIVLVWVYTFFWAFLPAFGFGTYGPEPYGTSCTINWWRMKSSLKDRLYIVLISILCFGLPALIIVTSYLVILLTVYRSGHTLASMPSSSVIHRSKDLRLAKMAAVVCCTFFLSWLPYTTVSLMSAMISSDDHEAKSPLLGLVEGFAGGALGSPNSTQILDVPPLLNWTAVEEIYNNPENKWSQVNKSIGPSDVSGPPLDRAADPMSGSAWTTSSLPPVVTLIPAMLAKSHCMFNPIIYQMMSREFRDDVFAMVFSQDRSRGGQTYVSSLPLPGSVTLSHSQSLSRKRSSTISVFVDGQWTNPEKRKNQTSLRETRDNTMSTRPEVITVLSLLPAALVG